MSRGRAAITSGDASRRPKVGPMVSATDVIWALHSQPRTPHPLFVKAVFKSYVEMKIARGKTKDQIAMKLEVLERELTQHAEEFRAVRAETGLPPSNVLPPPNLIRRANTSQPSTPTRPGSGVPRINTSAGVTANRPATNDSEELPPPPYASQDPEPESTRVLQERLAAEAEAEGRVVPPLSTPNLPTQTVSYAPPPGHPPRRPSAGPSRPPATTTPAVVARRPSSPDAQPSDEEEAKVWEESQFDEAKRASIAAEREREELEQALHLSLVESKRTGSAQEESPGGHGISTGFEDDNDGPSSRRISSYDPPARTEATAHRRIASDAGANLSRDTGGAGAGGNMPGQWQRHFTPDSIGSRAHGSSANGSMPGQWHGQTHATSGSLIDEDDNLASLPALMPSKTGAVLQSKNPFLSPQEGSAEQASSSPFLGMDVGSPVSAPPRSTSFGGMDQLSPTSASRQPSSSSLHSGPGLAYTAYSSANKAPPPDPSQERFAPQGPLPAHLHIATLPGAGENPGLAPRPNSNPDVSTRAGDSSRPLPRPPPSSSKLLRGQLGNSVNEDDPLAMLERFDKVFLVDDSASMVGEGWENARNALMGVAQIAETYDEDGVDVYFLNSKRVGKELKTAQDVEDLFLGLVPRGSIPSGLRLESILRDYLSRLESAVLSTPVGEAPGLREKVKPLNLMVITDGAFIRPVLSRMRDLSTDLLSGDAAPTDDPESVLISTAKRLDRGGFPLSQLRVQFLQIGDGVEVREALQELDNGLSAKHDVRDIVDTVPFTGEPMSAGLIVKTLLSGINRRLQRRGVATA